MKTGIQKLQKMNKKKLSTLDKYLIYCLAFFTAYSIAELTVSSLTGVTHDALTVAIAGFCGGEAFLCCMIKKLKLKRGGSEDEQTYQ